MTHFCVVQLQELYHSLEFPVVFALMNRGHYASSEKAFIVTLTELAADVSNVELADTFGFAGDGMVSLIYRFMIGILNNKARGLLHDGAFVCSVGHIFFLSLQKLSGGSLTCHNTVDWRLRVVA